MIVFLATVLTLWVVSLVGKLICDSLDLLSYKSDVWSLLKNLTLILVTGMLGLLFCIYTSN